MKIQCTLCKEIVPIGRFAVTDDGGIDITCEACAGSFHVSPTSGQGDDSPADDESAEPRAQMRCPKCDEPQPPADSCRACGLRAELFDDYAERADADVPAELELLWQSCREEWDDADRHARFVEGASASSSYAYAARRYRAVLRDEPDEPRARAGLDRLTRMAEATLLAGAAARQVDSGGREPFKNVVLLMVALVFLAGAGGIYFLVKRATDDTPNPELAPGMELQGPRTRGQAVPPAPGSDPSRPHRVTPVPRRGP